MRETTSRYIFAVDYARQKYGDLPASRYQELRSLAETLSRIELRDLIDEWASKPSSDTWASRIKLVAPSPVVPAWGESNLNPVVPEFPRTPGCRHWGGNWSCPRCKLKNTEEGVHLTSALALAQEMYEKHRKFVLDRMHRELSPYMSGYPTSSFERFADLEQEIWAAVATRIAKYEDRGIKPLAWLKTVVHSVVTDHFKQAWAKKRGAKVTDQLRGGVPAQGDGVLAVPDKPTAIPIKPENDCRGVVWNEADIPFRK